MLWCSMNTYIGSQRMRYRSRAGRAESRVHSLNQNRASLILLNSRSIYPLILRTAWSSYVCALCRKVLQACHKHHSPMDCFELWSSVIVIIFMGIIKPQFTRVHSGTYHGYFADIIFYSESEMKLICSTFSLLLVLHSASARRSRQVRYNKLSSNISLSSANTSD